MTDQKQKSRSFSYFYLFVSTFIFFVRFIFVLFWAVGFSLKKNKELLYQIIRNRNLSSREFNEMFSNENIDEIHERFNVELNCRIEQIRKDLKDKYGDSFIIGEIKN